jgi:predicted DNA-binding transcriptional regulator AlpA
MYYKIREVAERYGVAPHTIWQWVNDDFFPRPYMFGPGTARWPEDDLQAFDAEFGARSTKWTPSRPQVDLRRPSD